MYTKLKHHRIAFILTWEATPILPSFKMLIAILYPSPKFPMMLLSGTFIKIRTYHVIVDFRKNNIGIDLDESIP